MLQLPSGIPDCSWGCIRKELVLTYSGTWNEWNTLAYLYELAALFISWAIAQPISCTPLHISRWDTHLKALSIQYILPLSSREKKDPAVSWTGVQSSMTRSLQTVPFGTIPKLDFYLSSLQSKHTASQCSSNAMTEEINSVNPCEWYLYNLASSAP